MVTIIYLWNNQLICKLNWTLFSILFPTFDRALRSILLTLELKLCIIQHILCGFLQLYDRSWYYKWFIQQAYKNNAEADIRSWTYKIHFMPCSHGLAFRFISLCRICIAFKDIRQYLSSGARTCPIVDLCNSFLHAVRESSVIFICWMFSRFSFFTSGERRCWRENSLSIEKSLNVILSYIASIDLLNTNRLEMTLVAVQHT